MASVNSVTILGNLGDNPVIRVMPSGDKVANISVATNEKWKDANGDMQERTEWHRISFFGKLADIAESYLAKGNPVYVEGRLHTRKWQDTNDVTRYSTDIIGRRIQLLGAPNVKPELKLAPKAASKVPPKKAAPKAAALDAEDEFPF